MKRNVILTCDQKPTYNGGPDPLAARNNFRGVSRPIVKYTEYPACDRYSQPYSVNGGSDVAFRYQYCGILFIVSETGACDTQRNPSAA